MERIAGLDQNTSLFFNQQTPEAVDMFVGMTQRNCDGIFIEKNYSEVNVNESISCNRYAK